MGQDLSQPSLQLQRTNSFKHTHNLSGSKVKKIESSKTICIETDLNEIVIEVFEDYLTCGWLLSEAIRQYKGEKNIIALKSAKNFEALDCWLLQFERNLHPLKNKERLQAVFQQKNGKFGPKAFEPVKMIGKGGFSHVVQVRKKDTGELFAIKILKKQLLINENKIDQILIERNILQSSSSPFIVKLHSAYQTKRELHLVMDFCPGGELFYHLHNLVRLTEEQSRFYISEILLGLEYLHSHNIVYRDLKPENVLLDLDGHIKLTDFGLSKENFQSGHKANSFCGSPEYMSPEMLRGSGHNQAVDFYGLGAILYEMLTGRPPFYNANRSVMFNNILHDNVNMPGFISTEASDLIRKLLCKDPDERLGSKNGTIEVKSHNWFKGVSWKKVMRKRMVPPYRPNFRCSNFDGDFVRLPVSIETFSANRCKSDELFLGFDFAVEERDSLISTECSKNSAAETLVDKRDKEMKGKHRRLKDFDIEGLISGHSHQVKNLVNELRPTDKRTSFRKQRNYIKSQEAVHND